MNNVELAQVTFSNGGDLFGPSEGDDPIGITIQFLSAEAANSDAPTGTGADKFSWVYTPNATGGSWVGELIADVEAGFQGFINMPVLVTGGAGPLAVININLNNTSQFNPPTGQNIPANDNASIALPIQPADPLPVELLTFTGELTGSIVQLDWITATELNNAGFEIHRSKDGINWSPIGWKDGHGTTTIRQEYQDLDKSPYFGENYYRLKQLDYDGQYEYSNIIVVNVNAKDMGVNVFPNPNGGRFTTTVSNPNKEKMILGIYNQIGGEIWNSGTIEDVDAWSNEFNYPNLKEGVYYFRAIIGEEVITKDIIIVDDRP